MNLHLLKSAANFLTRLLAIRAGEEKKTLLLYTLHLLFYLGLMWGEFASETLFLQAWGADSLAWMFVGNALIALALALVYALFVDWFSNQRLLFLIIYGMIGWLLSVRLLLMTHGGEHGAVYPYFYLAYGALRDLSTLHILNYINDFYDTRAAKTALPLMLSAGIVGGTLAGLTSPLLSQTIGIENVTLAWALCLAGVLSWLLVIRRELHPELRAIRNAVRAQRATATAGTRTLENLHAGWRFVVGSSQLRWLAVATFAMVALMKLLTFQSSQVFIAQFQNDPQGLFNFYGLLGGFSAALGLALQTLFLGRIIDRLGVGAANLIFPALTFVSIGALNFAPNLATAILGRLDLSMFKQAIRNPLDAMLYNSVPLHIKGRAKAFVNALVVPLGTLIAGVGLLGVQASASPTWVIAGLGSATAALYMLAAWRVRTAYSHALGELLAGDEINIFRLSQDEFAQPDPATLKFLERRFQDSTNDEMTIFLAEMLADLEGRAIIPRLAEDATQRSPRVRAGIIQTLGTAWINETSVRSLCLQGIVDRDAAVRQAAASALAAAPDAIKNKDWLDLFLGLLNDPDERVRAAVLPPLISVTRMEYTAPASTLAAQWLHDAANAEHRILGLHALARTRDERWINTVRDYLRDRESTVRVVAAQVLTRMLDHTRAESARRGALASFIRAVSDEDELVRLAAMDGLASINTLAASRGLLPALNETSFVTRRHACAVMIALPDPGLEFDSALTPENYYAVESAILIQATRKHPRARRRALEQMDDLIVNVYALQIHAHTLERWHTASARLTQALYREYATALLDRVFWIAGARGNETHTLTIRRALAADDARTRANAAEALEAITSPHLARRIIPLFDAISPAELARIAGEKLGAPTVTATAPFGFLWQQLAAETQVARPGLAVELLIADGWATAIAIHAQLENLDTPQATIVRAALQATLDDPRPIVRNTAQWGLDRLNNQRGETMLTPIAQVVFLKEVSFFQGMTIEQLRVLTSISEEAMYEPQQTIIAQGERSETLYVIVSGRVSVQARGKRRDSVARLATLGPKDCFGETAFFSEEPHSADVVTLEPTHLLLVRQAPFTALIRQHPDLAISLLKVLSLRLREAHTALAEKTQSKPRELQNLYDKLG